MLERSFAWPNMRIISTLGVDFIVKLPILAGHDSKMVVVDHYTKGARFIPAKESWTASQLANRKNSSLIETRPSGANQRGTERLPPPFWFTPFLFPHGLSPTYWVINAVLGRTKSRRIRGSSSNAAKPARRTAPCRRLLLPRRFGLAVTELHQSQTTSPGARLPANRSFSGVFMVGRNAAELQLTPPYQRLHPVFNVPLLMPAKDPSLTLLPNPADLASPYTLGNSLAHWMVVSRILRHGVGHTKHEYLLRGATQDMENDVWVSLGRISRGLDIHVCAYHDLHWRLPRLDWDVSTDCSRPDLEFVASRPPFCGFSGPA
ncbi:hypothetical protein CROQUDRAFT_95759 [Cronartium quercuum f. sp. fusiforme G11]|uniref:Uncharacterized protein n=1 Tax=Cronartium quercuum f. sp. fusiforme G11 TaxID=708437 RepID=A0A9P6NGW7_9BASI|nr:hypothetical protein CROQUDRAFT_95759 [Cronartium quercuum f. sp. fusiforme G11]